MSDTKTPSQSEKKTPEIVEQKSLPVARKDPSKGPNNQRTKVCLVGSASSSANKVPWEDESFDVWGLAWRSLKRCDAYFDIHPIDDTRQKVQQNYVGRLASLKKPIYLQTKHPAIPNSVRYPIEDVIKFLQSGDPYANGDYFASSIAYMLALAIYKGYHEIHLYGIDLLCVDEYAFQRPNAEYLVGLARGLGIKVYIPTESAMCKFPLRYGYDREQETGILTKEILVDRIKAYKNKQEDAKCMSYMADGAAQALEELEKMIDHHKRGGQIVRKS